MTDATRGRSGDTCGLPLGLGVGRWWARLGNDRLRPRRRLRLLGGVGQGRFRNAATILGRGETRRAGLAAHLVVLVLHELQKDVVGLIDRQPGVHPVGEALHGHAARRRPHAADLALVAADALQLALQLPGKRDAVARKGDRPRRFRNRRTRRLACALGQHDDDCSFIGGCRLIRPAESKREGAGGNASPRQDDEMPDHVVHRMPRRDLRGHGIQRETCGQRKTGRRRASRCGSRRRTMTAQGCYAGFALRAATRFSMSRMRALPIGASVSTPSDSVSRASMM